MRITVAQPLEARRERIIIEHKWATFGEETDQTTTAWPTIEPQRHGISLWGVFAFHKPANNIMTNEIAAERNFTHAVYKYDVFS